MTGYQQVLAATLRSYMRLCNNFRGSYCLLFDRSLKPGPTARNQSQYRIQFP